MRKLAASLAALGWLMAGACSETSPTAVALITSVRYERLSQTSGTPPSQVMIEISIPSSKRIPFCMAQLQPDATYACPTQNLNFRFDESMLAWVVEPGADRWVGRRIWINGQELTRVLPSPTNEMAQFAISSSGRVY